MQGLGLGEHLSCGDHKGKLKGHDYHGFFQLSKGVGFGTGLKMQAFVCEALSRNSATAGVHLPVSRALYEFKC